MQGEGRYMITVSTAEGGWLWKVLHERPDLPPRFWAELSALRDDVYAASVTEEARVRLKNREVKL